MNKRCRVNCLCGLLTVLLMLGVAGCSDKRSSGEPAAFIPDEIGEQIEASQQVDLVFSGQIFPGAHTLYFADTVLPAEELLIFCYDRHAQELSPVRVRLPGELVYDAVRPVYVGTGGGSLECWFALELKNGADTTYIAYDNFTSGDMLAFEYRGILSEEQRETVLQFIEGQAV